MIGDADGDRAITFRAYPFVAAGVFELGRDVHGGSLKSRVADRVKKGIVKAMGAISDQCLAVPDKTGFDDLGFELLAANVDFNLVARRSAQRQAGEGDGLL